MRDFSFFILEVGCIMKKIIFTNDNNVEILIPENFNDNNGNPYVWFDQYKFNTENKEQKMRLIVSNLLNKNIINKNLNIIDSGAFIGDNALPWARNINGIVYAIDPSSNNKNLINYLSGINKITNIVYYESILADKIKEVSYNGDLDFNSFAYENGANKIYTTSLDILYNNKKIENIDFIHLDVEGLEYEAIIGGAKLIDDYNPVIIFEQHINTDLHTYELLNFLSKKEYHNFIIDEVTGHNTDCRNFISVPDNRYDNFIRNFDHMSFLINADKLEHEKNKIK